MVTIHGGRTHTLWPELEKEAANSRAGGKRCLLIVPEQYTLQAEKDLISGLHLKGFFDIEVFSYSRFIQRLFLLYNPGHQKRVDGNGKNIAIARALIKCKKNMRYYARSCERKGFITQSGEWIADMKRAEISPAQLSEYAFSLKESAYKEKISDLSLVYSAYDKLLAGKFVDGEDVLSRAIDAVAKTNLVADKDIFVYGFDVITDDFARLLCAVARLCENVHVYLAMDREEAADGDCFSPVRDSAERLRARLKEQNIPRRWLWCKEVTSPFPEDIAYLEKNLLRSAPVPFESVPDNISSFVAATPYTEVHYIAQEITTLLDSGVSPDDINVVCGNMPLYAPLFEIIFRAYCIPAYVARKVPLSSHGLIRMLLSAVRAVTGGYRKEDMLALIKSGFAPLEENVAWTLENYVLRYGISGKRWHAPFNRGSEAEREIPESARSLLSPLLLALQNAIREAKNGAESLKALMDFLISCNAYEALVLQEENLLNAQLSAEAVRSRQVWSHLLALMEQMHEIAGESRIPGSVMATWLEAGLIDDDISALPPAAGMVVVGEIGNLILHSPQYVFACALNSSLDESSENGLLNAEEKALAGEDMHAYLGMTIRERDRMSELDQWKVLSAPTKKLFVSHAQANQSGTAFRPAQALHTLKRLFPALMEYGSADASQSVLHPLAPMPTLDEIGIKLRNGTLTGEWLEAFKWLLSNESTRSAALTLLSAASDTLPADPISPTLARQLFTDRVVSISRLESYAACPYSHFVQYGLRPQERKEWKIERSETGTFYHAAMEGFTKSLTGCAQWPNITRKECDQLMDAALRPLTESWQDQIMTDSARAKAEGKRYINICKRVAWAFTKGAAQSDFRPQQGEIAFGYPNTLPALTLNLSDGTKVYVRGRIDRVDRFESDESVYLRVIDYKSGVKSLDPAKIWMGMQLQLLLYLEAMLQSEPDSIPAGAFYQWMGDPLIDQSKKGLIESEIAKKLCLKGVMLSDVQVIEWMDHSKPPISIEDVLKKDGAVRKGKLACTLDELKSLIDLAHRTAVRLSGEI